MSLTNEGAVSLTQRTIEVNGAEHSLNVSGSSYDDVFTGGHRTAVQSAPRRAQLQARTPQKNGRPSITSTGESRAAFRQHWRNAQEAADAMIQAAKDDERMGLAVAADDLDQTLAKLWDLRETRDIDWQTILNHAQGMMRCFFQEKKAEYLTVEQCQKIALLVKDYLGPATKSVDDLNEALRLIEDAGFDPYAAISGDPVDVENEQDRQN